MSPSALRTTRLVYPGRLNPIAGCAQDHSHAGPCGRFAVRASRSANLTPSAQAHSSPLRRLLKLREKLDSTRAQKKPALFERRRREESSARPKAEAENAPLAQPNPKGAQAGARTSPGFFVPSGAQKKPAASYSRMGGSHTTLGDGALDCRVRNGNGYDNSSMATGGKPESRGLKRTTTHTREERGLFISEVK